MTKREFLDRLRAALGNDLSGALVQENVDYYNEYISEAVSAGRSELDVVAELGDPWAIAKSIVDSMGSKGNAQESYVYETDRPRNDKKSGKQTNVHVFGLDTWWKKLAVILGIVGIIVIVVAVIGGVISLLAPLVLPFLIIMFVFRVLGRRK